MITFTCNRKEALGQPYFVEYTDNTYYFRFPTSLACSPEPVECSVMDNSGNEFDLSRLAMTNGAWEVKESDGSSFFINVCQPIGTASGSKCAGQ